jgi:hypothetical protein
MIVYDLACPHGHRFEGWFASGDDFAAQKARELVRCPICDHAGVAIVPSAKVATPRAGTTGAAGHAGSRRGAAGRTGSRGHGERAADPARHGDAPDADAGDAVPANFASGLPAEMLSKLREIVRAAEDVGRRFPEEARRIHYDEAPARPIRGQASREETAELREEGIDVSPLPPFLTGDEH